MRKPAFQGLVIGCLIIFAFGIRMYNITRPPLDYAPLRQYQSAHIVRGYYFENNDNIPEWRRHVADINMKRMGLLLEPRILEFAALFGYHILGGEHLWVPRVLSSIFWMAGGLFLFLLAKKLTSPGAALFSAAFFLFLPFGIAASRSFQPDPLMTMAVIMSIYAIWVFYEEASNVRLLVAAAVSAFAIFIKPYTLFPIFCVFLFLSINKNGIRKTVFNKKLYMFLSLCLMPVILYYGHKIYLNTGFLQEQAQASFIPHLLFEAYFWKDWLTMIGRVTGYIPTACAFLALFYARPGMSRALMLGLWIGYFIFGIFFTTHIHTHEYYQLQFIPIVALSLGVVGERAGGLLSCLSGSKKRIIAVTLVFIFAVSAVGFGFLTMKGEDRREGIKTAAAFLGVYPRFHLFITQDFKRRAGAAEEIGKIVGHSDNTVLLTPDFGRIVAYHGELSGLPWPISASLKERRERGIWIPQKDELFHSDYLTIRTHGKYIKYTPDFFIITAFDEFEEQKDLGDFLNMNFPVLAESKDYLIYDLRGMSGSKN